MDEKTPPRFRTLADENVEYFIQINGEEKGPYLYKELQKLYTNNHIGPFDKVRKGDSEEWLELLKVIEIDKSPQQNNQPHSNQNSNSYSQQQRPFITQPQVSNNTLAAIINVFFPGVGQLIQERVGLGIIFFFGTIIGYICFIVPGLIVHIICIVDAANYKPPHKF
jgi:TM2 domain-containing membrane protein YozV